MKNITNIDVVINAVKSFKSFYLFIALKCIFIKITSFASNDGL